MLIEDMETQRGSDITTAFDNLNSSRQEQSGAAHPSSSDLEGVGGTAQQSRRCGHMMIYYCWGISG